MGTDRARQGLSPRTLRAPILVAGAAKCRRLVIEVDDFGKLSKADVRSQDFRPDLGLFLTWIQESAGIEGLHGYKSTQSSAWIDG
ncbi:MAG: hypothetical protein ACLPTJ_20640 [Solirubrobacteraceae bacterium]